MRKAAVFILLFCSVSYFSQTINDSLITACINKTISYTFKDTIFKKLTKRKPPIIIATDLDTLHLLKEVDDKQVLYITARYKKYKKLLKTKDEDGQSVYTLSYEIYKSRDTIDVVIGESKILFKKKMIYVAHSCGGTAGYIPNGRFVFNGENKQWRCYSWSEMADAYFYKIKK